MTDDPRSRKPATTHTRADLVAVSYTHLRAPRPEGISYAVFCLQKKRPSIIYTYTHLKPH